MVKLVGIFISPERGQPMQSIQQVAAIAGTGLEADRYALDKGSYSFQINKRFRVEQRESVRPQRQVSLFSLSALNDANVLLPHPFLPIETRRNLLIDGISAADLLSLIDREFTVGAVRMRGVEDCAPCSLPGKMANKTGFNDAFAACGGLRAEILSSGVIRIGDYVHFNSRIVS
ncbi:MAG: MOSC domain-containing protein [Planctomycetota bacterium]